MSDAAGQIRIPKSTIEKLFSILRYDERSGKWKNKTDAANETGLSRPTVDKILKRYPHGLPSKAKLGEGKYVERFEQSDAWQRLKDHKYSDLIHFTMKEAFRLLGNREPTTWSVDDLKDLRKPRITREGQTRLNVLFKLKTEDISPYHATQLRRAFKDLNLSQLTTAALSDVEKGFTATRLDWYLRDNQVAPIINKIADIETLLFAVLELQCGARPISMVSTKVSDLKFEDSPPYLHYFESKNKVAGQRYFIPETWRLIQRYVSDRGLKPHERLFSEAQETYSMRFKAAGVEAGIELFNQKEAAAYVLRHTFATQASDHDVSLEVVMKQGGWSEASTLVKHYIAVKRSKMTRELLGDSQVEQTQSFSEWIRQFVPTWESRYAFLRTTKHGGVAVHHGARRAAA